jgi:hypothetical protein
MPFPNASSSLGEHAIPVLVGSIFITAATTLPSWLRFNYEHYGAWRKLIEANSYTLERTALAGGWHFSYIMPAVQHAAWGLSLQSAVQRATENVFNLVSGVYVSRPPSPINDRPYGGSLPRHDYCARGSGYATFSHTGRESNRAPLWKTMVTFL